MAVNIINIVSISAAIFVAFGIYPGLASDNVVKLGHDIVTDKCASCHAVGKDGESPLKDAPPFRDLHLRYDVENLSEALVEGIATAHLKMPQFVFSAEDAGAIVSYLKSLEE